MSVKNIELTELRSKKYPLARGPQVVKTTEIAAFAREDDSRLAIVFKEHVDQDYCVAVLERELPPGRDRPSPMSPYRCIDMIVVGQRAGPAVSKALEHLEPGVGVSPKFQEAWDLCGEDVVRFAHEMFGDKP